jgi:hypothetical protein
MPHVSACLEAQLLLVGGKHQSALLGLRLRVLLAVLLVACLCLLRVQQVNEPLVLCASRGFPNMLRLDCLICPAAGMTLIDGRSVRTP